MTRTRLAPLITATFVALLAFGAPAAAQQGNGSSNNKGEPARGTVKIEGEDMGEAAPPNEVKAGCAFRIDFFGFDAQTVPVRLSLQPPSGSEQLTERHAQLEQARGNDLSGSLTVDLTEELSSVPPAHPADFDYKIRVDVVVKETPGTEVTKSTMLFLDCPDAVEAFVPPEERDDDAAPEREDEVETEVLGRVLERGGDEDDAAVAAQQADRSARAQHAEQGEVARPTIVPAGSAGLAASTPPAWVALLMILGLAAMVAPTPATPARRDRSPWTAGE